MKFDIKKIYKSTIKTLEAHEVELSIALTAISLLAFMPEEMDEDALALKEQILAVKESNAKHLEALKLLMD